MWSVLADGWRTLADYAGVAAEILAAIVIGLLITILVLMVHPEIGRGASNDALGGVIDLAPSAEGPSN